MAKIMKAAAFAFTLITVACAALYMRVKNGLVFALLLTFGTTAYHFVMRLLVGAVFDRWMQNRADYEAKWFQVSDWEQRIYERLNVKQWKRNIPTYDPSGFDGKLHSWEEIVQAMCQAELVHETIMVLSFAPVLLAIPFGELWVFAITSVCAACIDGMFVIVQQYNRPRVMRLLHRKTEEA